MIHLNEASSERPHVHVYQGREEVKILLGDDNTPPSIDRPRGMALHDQRDALNVVQDNLGHLRKAWDDHH